MGIIELIEKLRNRESEPEEDIDDDVTRDQGLRSLRRQRRVQMEEIEKAQLKEKILEFQREKARGIFGREIKRKKIIVMKQKRKSIGKQEGFLQRANL